MCSFCPLQAGASIKLDDLLISGLYGKKERPPLGHEERFEEVLRRLLGKLQLFHKVSRVAEQVGLSLIAVWSGGCAAVKPRRCTVLCQGLTLRFGQLGWFMSKDSSGVQVPDAAASLLKCHHILMRSAAGACRGGEEGHSEESLCPAGRQTRR